jgi:vancomycin resistance protein YoaR
VQRARKKNADVPVEFKLDRARTALVLSRLAQKLEDDGTQNNEKVTLAQDGSLQRAVALIERNEETRPETAQPGLSYISLVLTRQKIAPVKPPVRLNETPDANAPQNFPYLLGSFSTKYDASLRGRTNNLRMAARNVNGTVVGAGEVFSANRAIGPRNAAAGWREAKMFVSGAVVSGVGAGICQCSTTIYNAALLAGFPIVERHQHYFRVMYAPASRDAAIAWGQKDFKFRNTSGGPILVKTSVHGGRFHVQIYGTHPMGVRVAVSSQITSRKGGTRSTAWRVLADENGERRETLSRDYYRPHP